MGDGQRSLEPFDGGARSVILRKRLPLLLIEADGQSRRLCWGEGSQQMSDLTHAGAESVEVVSQLGVVEIAETGKEAVNGGRSAK